MLDCRSYKHVYMISFLGMIKNSMECILWFKITYCLSDFYIKKGEIHGYTICAKFEDCVDESV